MPSAGAHELAASHEELGGGRAEAIVDSVVSAPVAINRGLDAGLNVGDRRHPHLRLKARGVNTGRKLTTCPGTHTTLSQHQHQR
jgi:hypothetical protein